MAQGYTGSPLLDRPLRAAIADPPYVGMSAKHYSGHEDYAGEVDHDALIQKLIRYDTWALCCSSPSLHLLLDLCRGHGLDLMNNDIRVMVWCKSFCAFKRNVRVAYAWEPVIVKVADRLQGALPTRDFVVEPITLKKGLTGVKPEKWSHWLFGAMGLRPTDTLDDLFPGSGAIGNAFESWRELAA